MKIEHDNPARNPGLPPAAACAVVPVMVSQASSQVVLGISGRRFREMVIRYQIRHVRDGKLVLVLVADWTAAMTKLATGAPANEPTTTNDAAPIASVDERLARMGLRRTG